MTRCLSILNSWTVGTNAISQTVALPAGTYSLTFDMRYDCANESRRTAANVVNTTGGNINTALCGLVVGSQEYYAPYPDAANTWQQQAIHFTLDEASDVTFRLGLKTSANQGAANNTRLYIDNLHVWQLADVVVDGIGGIDNSERKKENMHGVMYDLSGRQLSQVPAKGFFIQAGHKVVR